MSANYSYNDNNSAGESNDGGDTVTISKATLTGIQAGLRPDGDVEFRLSTTLGEFSLTPERAAELLTNGKQFDGDGSGSSGDNAADDTNADDYVPRSVLFSTDGDAMAVDGSELFVLLNGMANKLAADLASSTASSTATDPSSNTGVAQPTTTPDYSAALGIFSDVDVSTGLRNFVRNMLPTDEPALAHLEDFQEADISLGRENPSSERRSQLLGRLWFGRQEGIGALPRHIEIDHIVPYSLGGAHSSANATLLSKSANCSKGNKFTFEMLLTAGSIDAAARAIAVSAQNGNAAHGPYTGGVPPPETFDYDMAAVSDVNDGMSITTNKKIIRDMARAEKEGVPKKANGELDRRFNTTRQLKGDGSPDKRVREASEFRGNDAGVKFRVPGLRFKTDGTVDQRCKAFRSKTIGIRGDGRLDMRTLDGNHKVFPGEDERGAIALVNGSPARPADSSASPSASRSPSPQSNSQDRAPASPARQVGSSSSSSSTPPGTPPPSATAPSVPGLRFKADGTVDLRCKAVRSGAVRVRSDGQVDMRTVPRSSLSPSCSPPAPASSSQAVAGAHSTPATPARGTSSTPATPARSTSTTPATPSRSTSSTPARTPSSTSTSTPARSSSSSAAASVPGLRFKSDGTVDRRCSPVRNGTVRVRNDGQVDMRTVPRSTSSPARSSTARSTSTASSYSSPASSSYSSPSSSRTYSTPATVRYTQSGAVDKRCSAYRRGLI